MGEKIGEYTSGVYEREIKKGEYTTVVYAKGKFR